MPTADKVADRQRTEQEPNPQNPGYPHAEAQLSENPVKEIEVIGKRYFL